MVDAPAADAAQPAHAPVASPGAPRDLVGRVLLAEDGPDNQRLIGALLRRTGVEVVVVDNGQAAVEEALGALVEGGWGPSRSCARADTTGPSSR